MIIIINDITVIFRVGFGQLLLGRVLLIGMRLNWLGLLFFRGT